MMLTLSQRRKSPRRPTAGWRWVYAGVNTDDVNKSSGFEVLGKFGLVEDVVGGFGRRSGWARSVADGEVRAALGRPRAASSGSARFGPGPGASRPRVSSGLGRARQALAVRGRPDNGGAPYATPRNSRADHATALQSGPGRSCSGRPAGAAERPTHHLLHQRDRSIRADGSSDNSASRVMRDDRNPTCSVGV